MAKGKWSLILASSLVLALGACSEEKVKEPVEVETDAVEDKVSEDTVEEKADLEVETDEAEDTTDRTVTSGTYVGASDGNAIEIETVEAFQVYQLSKDVEKEMAAIKPESELTFTYYQNKEGKNVIISIQSIKAPKVIENNEKNEVKETVSKEWKFIGMIDGHSAEFEKDGQSVVAQYGPEQLEVVNQLGENDMVAVSYHENQHGQYVLESIVKK